MVCRSNRRTLEPNDVRSRHGDSNPINLFTAVASTLNEFELAYLHVAEAIKPGRLFNADAPRVTPHIRKAYKGVLLPTVGTTASQLNKPFVPVKRMRLLLASYSLRTLICRSD